MPIIAQHTFCSHRPTGVCGVAGRDTTICGSALSGPGGLRAPLCVWWCGRGEGQVLPPPWCKELLAGVLSFSPSRSPIPHDFGHYWLPTPQRLQGSFYFIFMETVEVNNNHHHHVMLQVRKLRARRISGLARKMAELGLEPRICKFK